MQDGIKLYWLCRTCEQMLGNWERQFASTIFHPITKNGSHLIAYSDWLLKFCVSISWRALLWAKEMTSRPNGSPPKKPCEFGAAHAKSLAKALAAMILFDTQWTP